MERPPMVFPILPSHVSHLLVVQPVCHCAVFYLLPHLYFQFQIHVCMFVRHLVLSQMSCAFTRHYMAQQCLPVCHLVFFSLSPVVRPHRSLYLLLLLLHLLPSCLVPVFLLFSLSPPPCSPLPFPTLTLIFPCLPSSPPSHLHPILSLFISLLPLRTLIRSMRNLKLARFATLLSLRVA